MQSRWARCAVLWGLTLLSSCRELSLPSERVPGPGTVRATVWVARPGRAGLTPAAGAQLRWTLSSAVATADADGNVFLEGITSSEGALRFTFEDNEKQVDVKLAQVGFGRDVNLGSLVLGRVATLTGTVRRGDRPSQTSGHADVAIFVPETSLLTRSGDTGAFELGGVAEGEVTVSFFAEGYAPRSVRWSVRAGERAQLDEVQLVRSSALQQGDVSCVLRSTAGSPIDGATVRLANATGARALESTEGGFTAKAIAAGLYGLTASAPGFKTLSVPNLLVLPGDNPLGVLVLAEGSDPQPDAGTSMSDGGLTVHGTFVTGAPPPGETDGLSLRAGALGFRARVCSGSLCVSGEVTP